MQKLHPSPNLSPLKCVLPGLPSPNAATAAMTLSLLSAPFIFTQSCLILLPLVSSWTLEPADALLIQQHRLSLSSLDLSTPPFEPCQVSYPEMKGEDTRHQVVP